MSSETINWGLPVATRKRSANKVEKYTVPVISIEADKGKGKSRRIQLNKAAVEAFGIDFEVEEGSPEAEFFLTLGFTPDSTMVIVSTTSIAPTSLTINKSFGTRDKRTVEFLDTHLPLDNTKAADLLLTPVEGESHYKVESVIQEGAPTTNEEEEVPTEVPAEEVVLESIEDKIEEGTLSESEQANLDANARLQASTEEDEVEDFMADAEVDEKEEVSEDTATDSETEDEW